MLARWIVKLAYLVDKFDTYYRTKHFFYNLLENRQSRLRGYYDITLMLIVISSILLLIYDVSHDLPPYALAFEHFTVTLFIAEYILRFWVYNHTHKDIIELHKKSELNFAPLTVWPVFRVVLKRKWDYVSSPLAIIDLLAILPSYRPLRVLRIFLLFRLLKVFRYTNLFNEFAKIITEKRFEFQTLGFIFGFILFTSSTAIYLFEGNGVNEKITSFFDAVYWSIVTVFTVGYGDITPATEEGRIITITLIVSGVGAIAFLTSILVAGFTEKVNELSDHRILSLIEQKGNCTLVCGYGRIGETVCQLLMQDKTLVVVVDNDPKKIEHAKRLNIPAICADAADSDFLQKIDMERRVNRVLCLSGDDVANVFMTLSIRSVAKDLSIIARANKTETINKLKLAGATHVITPYDIVALVASESIGQSVAFEAIYGLLTEEKHMAIDTIAVTETSYYAGKSISDFDFKAFRLIFLGVITEKNGAVTHHDYHYGEQRFVFNPPPEFLVPAQSMLVVFGNRIHCAKMRDHIATD